ncbi:aminotransferase class I/II-fold pyridoxal phosphate-dependent enzyme [Apilactobacillus apisilvae]|uniref:Aminotransferase n=1 Tax=Apilactobacillus apisilvae TaxID=2923364 RepID=A0ABY4PG06_9LACO|nr:aminotransferase class I/II-fold pyridoxal phosphate-dependent enzyme [Apilactobacillus apisilvae]UQS84441.1 aminotransferase class I/II-fold pyridoxal phosphate-dependent enzyme [Apilactobacillus apisilvae]
MPKLASSLTDVYNKSLDSLAPSGIRSFDKKISDIDGIIKLTIGEPDLNTPEHVKQAGVDSIMNNDSHYANQIGKKELRDAIANYLDKKHNLNYDSDSEIVVTVGATEAIYAAFQTILNPGDKVIVPTPTFALYFPIIQMLGATPVKVDTSDNGFVLSPDKLSQALDNEGSAVKAVLLNYPGNPTGVEYSKDDLEKLAKVIKERNLFVVSDEIYSDITYDVEHYSIATMLPEQTIYISGLSKSHAMTGYRVGYVCGPSEVIKKLSMVHAFLVTATTNSAQVAAAEALKNGMEDPVEMTKIYKKRRDTLQKGLTDMGFEMPQPKGAFYMFAKIPAEFGNDDEAFALELAKKAKVGVIPGSAFGPGGEGHIRFSYAASDAVIDEAVKRIKEYL